MHVEGPQMLQIQRRLVAFSRINGKKLLMFGQHLQNIWTTLNLVHAYKVIRRERYELKRVVIETTGV